FGDAFTARPSEFRSLPDGPVWGACEMRSQGVARERDLVALRDAESLALRAGMEAASLAQERRATRLRPRDLEWDWPEQGVLELRFALPPGAYATTVVAELGDVL